METLSKPRCNSMHVDSVAQPNFEGYQQTQSLPDSLRVEGAALCSDLQVSGLLFGAR